MKAALLLLAALSIAHADLASELEADGSGYKKVVYKSHDASRVYFFHDGGHTSFALLSELSPELQKQFNYDPDAATRLETESVAAQQEAAHRLGASVSPAVRLPQQQQILDALTAGDLSPLKGKDDELSLFFDFKESERKLSLGIFVRSKRETPRSKEELQKLEELAQPIIAALNQRLKGAITPIKKTDLFFAEQESCNFFTTTHCPYYVIPIRFHAP